MEPEKPHCTKNEWFFMTSNNFFVYFFKYKKSIQKNQDPAIYYEKVSFNQNF